MRIASYLYCALTSRLAELRTAEERDRGDRAILNLDPPPHLHGTLPQPSLA